jgi:O-antigen/teichoic acid export membrane protein
MPTPSRIKRSFDPRTPRGRLVLGTLANLGGKFWVLVSQLVSVPLLTHYWGADGYGTWLMLTAVPTYVALTDFGMGGPASVEMTRRYARHDNQGALAAFQSVWTAVTLISAVFLLISAGAVMARDFLSPWASPSQIIVVALLVVYSCMALQMSLLNAVFKCTGQYAKGTLLLDLCIPLELSALSLVVATGGTLVHATLALLVARATGLAAYYVVLKRKTQWFRLGTRYASWKELKALAAPSIGSLSITLSSAISLQGVILSIGHFYSPAAAGAFGAARTLTRAPLQLAGLATRAALPELSAALARQDEQAAQRLMRALLASTLAISIPAAIALAVAGPEIVHALSNGKLNVSTLLISALALAMVAQATWTTLSQKLVAINRHQSFTHYYVPLAALTALAPAISKAGSGGETVASTVAFAEGVMLLIVWLTVARHQPVSAAHSRSEPQKAK